MQVFTTNSDRPMNSQTAPALAPQGSRCAGTRRWPLAILTASLLVGFGTASAQSQPAPASAAAATIQVTNVQVEGNTLLPERVVRETTAPAVGTTTLDALKAVASALQAQYRRAGYGGVVVYLPQQAVAGGNVVFRVVEGRIARVKVTGQQHVSVNNVRAGIPSLREGEVARVERIDREIQLSNESPTKEVRITMTAGARPGEVDAEIQVKDDAPLKLLAGYSNTGDDGTGRHRVSVGLRHSNLLDRDHVGTLQYQTSPEHPSLVSVLSAGYRVPLYELGMSVDAFAAYSDVSVGTTVTPAGALDFTGRGTILGLRGNWSLPRWEGVEQRVTLGIDWRNYKNLCTLGTLGAAGCGPSGVSVRTLPLSVSYIAQQAIPGGSGGVSAGLYMNAGGSGQATFEAARPGAPRRYVIGRTSASGQWALPEGFGLAARGEAQFTGDALISAEKFGLGGLASVRGYRERELTGDSGYVVRVEGQGPEWGGEAGRVRPLVFVDHGRVSNRGDTACRSPAFTATHCALSSLGLGARFAIGTHTSGSVDIGRALNEAIATQRGDWRAHVAVNFIY